MSLGDDYRYNVVAEVTFVSGKAVIDFGLKAVRYADLLPRAAKKGDFASGTVYVGIPLSIEIHNHNLLPWHRVQEGESPDEI